MSGFVDTNILARYLTVATRQAPVAAEIIDHEPGLILNDAILGETAYSGRMFFNVDRVTIVDRLIELIQRENMSVFGLEKQIVVRAQLLCQPSGRGAFADALIWAAARSSGNPTVYSWDERFLANGIEVRRTP